MCYIQAYTNQMNKFTEHIVKHKRSNDTQYKFHSQKHYLAKPRKPRS